MIYGTRLVSLLALAVFLPLYQAKQLDVWSPQILSPNSTSIWVVGQCYNVTWDTNDRPNKITNDHGTIYLVKDMHIQIDHLLASNFSLTAGQVEIDVPYVEPGEYKIVLIGDSGNDSEPFEIVFQ